MLRLKLQHVSGFSSSDVLALGDSFDLSKSIQERVPRCHVHGRKTHGFNCFLCKDFIKFLLLKLSEDKTRGDQTFVEVIFNYFIFINFSVFNLLLLLRSYVSNWLGPSPICELQR